MGRKKADTTKSAPVAPQVNTGSTEQENQEPRYIVVRDGHRVSSQEYTTPTDPIALDEMTFWKLVENKHSWGAPVEIVQYDNRLHRVFTIA